MCSLNTSVSEALRLKLSGRSPFPKELRFLLVEPSRDVGE